MATFRIGTFYEPRMGPPLISWVSAYSRWYAASWDGCIEYDIEAESGAEAKKIARAKRLEHEKARHFGKPA